MKEISDGLTNMGNEVLGALKNVEQILKDNDHKLAKETIKNDLKINFYTASAKNDLITELSDQKLIVLLIF